MAGTLGTLQARARAGIGRDGYGAGASAHPRASRQIGSPSRSAPVGAKPARA
jgi:hypothetical protein